LRGFRDEKNQIYTGADCLCLTAGRSRHSGGGDTRKVGVGEAAFYRWRKKFAGVGVAELRGLRRLEEENRKLKQLVADLSMDKTMLRDVLSKKL
jgi:hypothetical protein